MTSQPAGSKLPILSQPLPLAWRTMTSGAGARSETRSATMTIGYSRPLALWTVRTGLGLGLQEADDRAQGGEAGGLVGAGDVEHFPPVGDALVAVRT